MAVIKIVRGTMTERDCYKDKNSDSDREYVETDLVAVTGVVTKDKSDINGDNGSDSKSNSDGDNDLNDENEKNITM